MPNCSSCGKYIHPTEIYRREMYIGQTRRIHYSKRISFGKSNHYRKQSVCKNCAEYIDETNRKRRTIRTIFFLVLIIVVLYFILK